MPELDTEVLIIGGGPTGLGLAIELKLRGISSVVLEQTTELHSIPKGQNLTQRTGEHFVRWSIADKIKAAQHIPSTFGNSGVVTYGNLLSPYNFSWFKRSQVGSYYAAENMRLPQYETEKILRNRVRELDEDILRLGTIYQSMEVSDSHVTVIAEDHEGKSHRYTARYLIGCDGSRSLVREHAGIELEVDDHERLMSLIVFQSKDLDSLIADHAGKAFFHIISPDLDGYWQFLGRVNLDGQWFYHAPTSHGSSNGRFDAAEQLFTTVGCKFDHDIEYIGFWNLRFAVAANYRKNRIFLAGDAAHNHPPYGGYGINLGFEDVRNLGWKLAAKIDGWGGDKLLDSYSTERKPIYVSTAEQFIKRMINADRDFVSKYNPDRDLEQFERGWQDFANSPQKEVLQYRPHYSGSPLVCGNSSGTTGASGIHKHEAFAGGHLSPLPIGNGENIYDRLSGGFDLICIGADDSTVTAYVDQADRTGLSVLVHNLEASDELERWKARTILVRPDNYIAMACTDHPDNIVPSLLQASGH